ncbi:hypothetical protein [Clostridium tyrobutyricum]|nr:hypothetical protein [Clostridium tyrobutyricum]MBV4437368.1 hypothetical protein [Clostridium tyrobutyricum]
MNMSCALPDKFADKTNKKKLKEMISMTEIMFVRIQDSFLLNLWLH